MVELVNFKITLDDETLSLVEKVSQAENAHRNKIRAEVNQQKRFEVISEYPVIKDLENSLKKFITSDYSSIFKQEVSWWVELRLYNFYKTLSELSKKEVNSCILNFEWYIEILDFMCRTYDLFYGRLFSMKNPDNPDENLSCATTDANLVIKMLDVCNSIIGK